MTAVMVVHTTESTKFAGTHRYFLANPGKQPNALYDPNSGEWHEYLPWPRPAKALRNLPGGVETNRRAGGVYQLEIIGKAAEVPGYEDRWYQNLAARVRMVCDACGIPKRFPRPFMAYPASYGLANSNRMTAAEWEACSGIVGHQHVPENDHGDPGDLNRLIPFITQETPGMAPTSARDTPTGLAQQAINAWLPEARRIAVDGDWGQKSTDALRYVLDTVAAPYISELETQVKQLTDTNTALQARVTDLLAQINAIQAGAGTDARTITLASLGAATAQWIDTVAEIREKLA